MENQHGMLLVSECDLGLAAFADAEPDHVGVEGNRPPELGHHEMHGTERAAFGSAGRPLGLGGGREHGPFRW